MDLMSTAQLLGNFGEFFGAIAVLATLVYLVVQIKQNTKMLRSSISNSWVQSRANVLNMMADHAHAFGKIYTQPSRRFRELDPAEVWLHIAFFTHQMNYFEQTYLQHLEGTIDDSIQELSQRQLVNLFYANGLHQQSWASSKGRIFDPRFIAHVDKHVLPEVKIELE